MEIIAMFNHKGGVAKTTTTTNLGAALAEIGKKVLMIDNDPQANLSKGLGFRRPEATIFEALCRNIPIGDVIIKDLPVPNLHLVPSGIRLANAEIELISEIGRESILKEQIETIRAQGYYDYVLIDCQPSLGLLTVNAITAADSVIIPLDPSPYSMDGVEDLMTTMQLVKRKLNPKLHVKGVLLTMVERTRLSQEVADELHKIFGDKVFKTMIHKNVRVKEAPGANLPVLVYDPTCTGAMQYRELAKEVSS